MMLSPFQRQKEELSGSTEFRMIGPRSSGKTAYLAALAYWSQVRKNSSIESITPLNDATQNFIDKAENILKRGDRVAGTDYTDNPESIPEYEIKITMNAEFNHQEFEITCKDFAGELFTKLQNKNITAIETYLEEYAQASGLFIMLEGTLSTQDQDIRYAQGLANLESALKSRLRSKKKSLSNYPIAIVWSKAEMSGMWNYRRRIPKFMNKKYLQTEQLLLRWKREWRCPMNYFFCSAFGVKGDDATPNVRPEKRPDGVTVGVIDDTELWQPFGLIAPIYWLYTGQDIAELRDLEG
ncbi:hypothetical protein [Crocosphaera sp.]|uniref:TRAFAC clade GTPase domain-containing protein n=1 Tax=Crocosphaera sp. TaxID=2729996 RepID=UPI002631ACCB|nr:hypothetical protein [Crocosphaera sp.]MDJ0581080.1 hypothetical protein [Crocosphaera sp.]